MKKTEKSLNEELINIKKWSVILEGGDNTVGVGDVSIPPGYRESWGENADIRTGTDLGATDQMDGYMDMGESEDDDIPYAEEIPDDRAPSVSGDIQSNLNKLKGEYQKIQKMVDTESVRVMSISLSEVVSNPQMAVEMEKKMEKVAEDVDKLYSYYDNLIDKYHEDIGYDDPVVDELSKLNRKVFYRQSDLGDIAELWYKYRNMAEDILEIYEKSPNRVKTLINLKKTEI